MRYLNIYTFISLLFIASTAYAQPCKELSLAEYDGWKTIQRQSISNDGNWFVYEQNPLVGDGELMIESLANKVQYKIARGANAKINPSSAFVAYKIVPPYDLVRKEKLAGKKGEKLPQDSLGIFLLQSKETLKYPMVNKFEVSEKEGTLVAWLHQPEYRLEDSTKLDSTAKKKAPKKKKSALKPALFGMYNAASGKSFQTDDVTDFTLAERNNVAFYIQQKNDSIDSCFVFRIDEKLNQAMLLFASVGQAKALSSDHLGEQLAFLYTADTAKNKVYSLAVWRKDSVTSIVIDDKSTRLPENYSVSEFGNLVFSEDRKALFLGIAPKPYNEPKDTLTEDEKVSVDIWNWKDDLLQTQQIKELDREKKRTYTAVYYLENDLFVQLANEKVPDVRTDLKNNPEWLMARSSKPYDYLTSWEQTRYEDVYRVNQKTGEMQLLLQKANSFETLRSDGNFLLFYDRTDSTWCSLQCDSKKIIKLTDNKQFAFYNIESDIPDEAGPYGFAGWTKEGFAIVYSQYDLWLLDPGGKQPATQLTHQPKTPRYRYRYIQLDRHEKFLPSRMYLSVLDELNKQSGFALLDAKKRQNTHLLLDDFQFSSLTKAKDAPVFLYEKESFTTFPDWIETNDNFTKPVKITNANPQQSEYCWGSVQLVHWNISNGKKLDGLMYLPAHYDSLTSVPMLVYFYERYSDQLHRYYQPKPSRSVINFSEYTSRGYAVFVPDIVYTTGLPGQSAYEAVLSGVDAMLKQFPKIDSTRMGLQGQSWGGYQTAWLVTRTNRFKAAMAGAPVSNMTSAYGGIRWESGMSRAFQYEDGQSRIGGDLWSNLDAYIENSPLFAANKVETPLLIMHNDADGAVPWYQGIEYFSALRRLRKPVWMLVYNNAPHNLRRLADMKDLTQRMQQFFDYYLMGAPEPLWMKEGVPAIKKGIETGFELKD